MTSKLESEGAKKKKKEKLTLSPRSNSPANWGQNESFSLAWGEKTWRSEIGDHNELKKSADGKQQRKIILLTFQLRDSSGRDERTVVYIRAIFFLLLPPQLLFIKLFWMGHSRRHGHKQCPALFSSIHSFIPKRKGILQQLWETIPNSPIHRSFHQLAHVSFLEENLPVGWSDGDDNRVVGKI